LEETFRLFVEKMATKVTHMMDEIKAGLSPNSILQESVIKDFAKLLEQVRNIDKIKEYGFAEYIKVDTASNIIDKIHREVNDIVSKLKYISIGDVKWCLFLEKIFTLYKAFPVEFEKLKDAAIKMYVESAASIYANYQKIFENEDLLKTYQNSRRGPELSRSNSMGPSKNSVSDIFKETKPRLSIRGGPR
jgi:hypothetical protein